MLDAEGENLDWEREMGAKTVAELRTTSEARSETGRE